MHNVVMTPGDGNERTDMTPVRSLSAVLVIPARAQSPAWRLTATAHSWSHQGTNGFTSKWQAAGKYAHAPMGSCRSWGAR